MNQWTKAGYFTSNDKALTIEGLQVHVKSKSAEIL